MTDFLVISGVSSNTIKQLENNPSDLFDLNCNKDEFVKIVSFLKFIGVKKIDELIIINTGLFLKTREEVEDLFSRHDTKKLVDEINKECESIFAIYE